MLECDMVRFTRSQSVLFSAGAAVLGGAGLATLLAGNMVSITGAGATAVEVSGPFDGAICSTQAPTGSPGMMLQAMFRLAQTEVPRAEMSAANAALAFADSEPPLWPGLGSITYKITTANERAQAYFDQGLRLAY